MSKRWFQTAMVLAALSIAVPLHADQGKGKAKGNPHKNQAGDQDSDRDDRWEHRGDYDYRTYEDREGTPPGWSKGKKTSWGNCGLPPGQAKKYGCQTYRYQGRDYYYYHDEVGRIVVRRPHIHIDVH